MINCWVTGRRFRKKRVERFIRNLFNKGREF
jgi:hypothetical protein